MTKEKSLPPEGKRLGDLILPQKEKVGQILSEINGAVNAEESELILGPFFDIMG